MSTQPLTIVIKLGSSSILQPCPPHFPQMSTLSSLAETCVSLRSLGHRIVIVSSGAIGMGLHRMDLPATTSSPGKSRSMGEKQALAAIGQGRLIALWDQIFGAFKIPIAQILLTRNDIADRSRYLNATTTLSTLLSLGVIPIINENDTISVSEILTLNKFGDNDTLSAIASGMCHADYLFLLTDVDGLYEDNPRRVPTARRVTTVRDIEAVRKLVSTKTLGSSLGTGGMETKLIAAELATAVGCNTVITLGNKPERILEIVNRHQPTTRPTTPTSSSINSTSFSSLPGVEFSSTSSPDSAPHTLFTRKPTPLTSRRFWILHGLTPRGTVYIDYGAYRAISRSSSNSSSSSSEGSHGNGGRLLAAGVVRVEGSFAAGQAVNVCVVLKDEKGFEVEEKEFGRGLSNYNSSEINKVKGLKSSDIEKVLGYYEAEHVVESVVELSRGGISTTTTTTSTTGDASKIVVEGLENLSVGAEKE